jgi:glyoxylase-like metal-dependent hydrolase (beta-lactamase superfamily II)
MDFKVYQCGYCTAKERTYKVGGSNEIQRFGGNSLLISHPKRGNIVVDTGYSKQLLEATQRFPFSIYRKLIPVFLEEGESLVEQLRRDGISQKDISHIIISHFHSDHYAGLKDFPDAKTICKRNGFDYLRRKKGLSAVMNGFIPELVPENLEFRAKYCEDKPRVNLPKDLQPFDRGYDLFGDGSIIAVSLEGHCRGQIGLLFDNNFFIADAVWSEDFYTEGREQTFLANLVMDDRKAFEDNLRKIRELHKNNPKLNIFHAHKKWEK